MTSGPLSGYKVVELAGMGPAPFAAMSLADMGAEVIRIDRPGGAELFPGDPRLDVLNRGKRSLVLDMKKAGASAVVLDLISNADALIEGFRPGVAERLGVGPEHCWERNPALVYGRMTGWGQTGPMAHQAGHDIDYIAITGALHAIGAADSAPQIPVNMVGDFGGGGIYLVVGVLAALLEARSSGQGQVVDAAIVDGAAHLLSGVHGMLATGTWEDRRGVNLLDGGAPFYSVYETSDRRHMAVGALENRFYTELVRILDVDLDPSTQNDKTTWPAIRRILAHAFSQQTQAEWTALFDGSDACVAPITGLRESSRQLHIQARATLVEREGVLQASPAPRFSRTESTLDLAPPRPGEHTREVLADWGIENADDLLSAGIAVQV